MKQFNFKNIVLAFLCVFALNSAVLAQTLTADKNVITVPPGGDITLTRSGNNSWSGSGSNSYLWTVSPAISGISFASTTTSNSTNTITFANTVLAGTYTVKVTRGTKSATTTITVYAANLWAANSNSPYSVSAFNVNGLTLNSGADAIFDTEEVFYALGRSTSSTPTGGFYYWIPTLTNNNGKLTVRGRAGDGSGSNTTIVSNFDIDQNSSSDVTYVRFALDASGTGWTLTKIDDKLNLTKIALNGLNAVTPVIVDGDVSLSGGSVSNFSNGDLCLDGSGNIYALANVTDGNTELYIGKPDASTGETTLTKRWVIKDNNGDNFTGTVNGCAFDEAGAMYLSTGDGIFYLDPGTIVPGTTGVSTIKAKLVTSQSNFYDLASNFFPMSTAMPVKFEELNGKIIGNELKLTWATGTESNNDRFEVEASKDGMNFVKIGEVKSKANNGNSSSKLLYDFALNYNSANALLGMSIFAAAFLLLAFNRRNKLLVMMVLFAGVSMFSYSCKKDSSEQIDVSNENKVFVRIKQIDKDGKFDYSKVITAYKAD